MPTTVSSGIIESKKFTVFIDISPNHLLCTDSFKHNRKVSTLRVPLKDGQMLALPTLLEMVGGSKLQKDLGCIMTMS